MHIGLRFLAASVTATMGFGMASTASAQVAHGRMGVSAIVMNCSTSTVPSNLPPAKGAREPAGSVAGVQIACNPGISPEIIMHEEVVGGSIGTAPPQAPEVGPGGQLGSATTDHRAVPQPGATVQVVTVTF